MSSLFGIGGNGAASFYKGVATQSLRFDDGSSAYLSRTPSSAGNRRTFTFSAWIKRGSSLDTSDKIIFGAGTGNSADFRIRLSDTNFFDLLSYNGSSYDFNIRTNQVFRDVSAWYHILVAFDTTQGTASNRIKIYVNGTQLTSFSTATYPSQNFEGFINNTSAHALGRYSWTSSAYFDGYMAEVNLVDGTALAPSSFGETKNGVWIAKKYTGSYGTNGFRLQFDQVGVGTASTSTIGADTSGNTNHFTSSGIVASDCAMPDSPENNFATLDPLSSGAGVFSEGNLKYVSTTDTGNGTFGITSGKAYFEVYIGGDTNIYVGIIDISDLNPNRGGGWTGHGAIAYRGNGTQYALPKGGGSAVTSYGASLATGDIVGVAFDVDADTVTFYKNNSSQGNTTNGPSHISSNGVYSFFVYGDNDTYIVNTGQDSSFAGTKTAQGNTDANGNGDFYYAPPSGYLALCTSNLPEPTIGPNSVTQADDHFNTVLWTGNATDRDITDVGFQPDWVWTKSRNVANSHYIFDSTRGVLKDLEADNNEAESTTADSLEAFISNGFSLGTDNNVNATGGYTYVAWNWKANGGTTTTNDASATGVGTIDSVIQANTTAGFSIVTYTGTGSNGTIAHGLGAVVRMVIIKNRDQTDNWAVGHTNIGFSNHLQLNVADASTSAAAVFNSTAPTSTVFSVGTNHKTNASSEDYVAYCFADVEGYSKFGEYTSNNSGTDNTFVYTGFRPAFLLVKMTPSGTEWVMMDNKKSSSGGGNPIDRGQYPNYNYAEYSGNKVDFLSNGFKVRDTSGVGYSTRHVIYMAFAEAPFKYANAR